MKSKLLFCLLTALLLSACAPEGPVDPYAAFRKQSATEIYQKGLHEMKRGNYADATKQFEALQALYPVR